MRIGKGLLPLLGLASLVPAPAQDVQTPEIRRAIPVPPRESAAPVSQDIPVMRAIPVSTPQVPTAVSAPTPAPMVTPAPQRVTTPVFNRTMGDDAGSIRLGPSSTSDPASAAKAQLAVADGFYSRKDPASAVTEYEKFLIMVPKDHPDREKALYRLGESQRQMGSSAAAEATYASLLSASATGPYRPGAAFRLGELRQAAGDPSAAATNFATAAAGTADASIRQAAIYRQAECFEKIGRQKEADALFTSLLATEASTTETADASPKSGPTNPYVIPTLLHLAANAAAAGNKEAAITYYGRILSSSATGEARAEAALRSAALLSELGKQEEARKLFATVAESKDAGSWHKVATLALLRLAAAAGDDDTVLKLSREAVSSDEENRPEILLLRADALRRKGRHAEALALYDSIMRETPRSAAAAKAPFQRLLSLHATRSPSLASEIDQYLLTASDPGDVARAKLLKAEATLAAKDYAGAAVLYGEIDASALPTGAKPDILYKQAWALLQSGNREGGTKALSMFLKNYPSEERAPAALAQRAMLRQESKDFEGALADFNLLAQTYPKAAERELALQQKALLLGQLQRNAEMDATFGELLRDYPKSKAAAQAHYWRGWVAFEAKDYAKALPELAEARTADPKQFGERAGLRILLCHYYLGDAPATAREAAAIKPSLIPPEVGRWLGQKSLESGDKAAAERFLAPLAKEGLPGATDPEIQGMLASALTGQGKFKEAQAPAAACLKLSGDPASRAKALLVLADIQRALKNFPAATSQIEEAMLLQPEGPINAEARLLSGDILASRQDFSGAAKAYLTVAYLNDDEGLAERAFGKAAEAYRRAGNTAEEQKVREELRKRQSHAAVSPSPAP
jgi:tetratricopeptide (TPR) repeat protein